jgi:hypothetical protein
MSSILCRRLLAGMLVSASVWATSALAQTSRVAAPAPNAVASVGHFTELCQTKLKLAPEQSSSLRTYLDQEVNYLNVLAVNGIAADTPNLTATEGAHLDEVLAKMLAPGQLRDYQKLRQTPQAQSCLRDMALLPDSPENFAKTNKAKQRRTAQMMAQRAEDAE